MSGLAWGVLTASFCCAPLDPSSGDVGSSMAFMISNSGTGKSQEFLLATLPESAGLLPLELQPWPIALVMLLGAFVLQMLVSSTAELDGLSRSFNLARLMLELPNFSPSWLWSACKGAGCSTGAACTCAWPLSAHLTHFAAFVSPLTSSLALDFILLSRLLSGTKSSLSSADGASLEAASLQ